MEVAYKRDMNHNYLVLTGEENNYGGSYQVRMMVTNTIPGLMKCNTRSVDNVVYFYYEITSKQPIVRVFEANSISYEVLMKILVGIKKALTGIKEYLLEANHLLLDPAHIYMDVESKEVIFCYYPSEKSKIEKSFHLLMEYILNKLDHNDRKAVVCGYEIYKSTLEENYNMSLIMKILHKNSNYEETHKVEEPDAKRERIVYTEEEKVNLLKEKAVAFKNGIGSEIHDNKIIERVEEQAKEKSKIKTYPVLKILGLVVMLGCFVGFIYLLLFKIIVLTSISTTQVGGVIFLLVGAIAYYLSDKKNKRKNDNSKNEENKGNERKEFDNRKDKRKNSCVKTDKRSVTCGRTDKWLKRNNNEESANESKILYNMRENPQAEANTFLDNSKEHRESVIVYPTTGEVHAGAYGETSLLTVQEHNGIMRLESQKPREYSDIEFSKEVAIIGKLENMSDVIINHASISRMHAKIEAGIEGVYMTDLNSTNGTYVNGIQFRANERKKIENGDRIVFSDLSYIFKID